MTFVGIRSGGDRPQLTLRGDALSPRVLRTGPDRARVSLVATTALLLAGDRIRIEIDVGPGCRLELVDTAGTVAYDGRGRPAGPESSWTADIRVAEAGTLTWHAEPFVVAAGASPNRTTTVELATGAVACLRETIVLGRSGETGGSLLSRTAVTLTGAPLLAELLDLDERTRALPGILGSVSVLDTALLLGARAPADQRGDVRLYQLAGTGTVARHLGSALHRSPIGRLHHAWSERIRPI